MILHACFVLCTSSSKNVMLESLAFIFVYRGNVGGNIRWLTVGENPIGFGASPVIPSFNSMNTSSNLL